MLTLGTVNQPFGPHVVAKVHGSTETVQRQALSAGYFFKYPLCNNSNVFWEAMSEFGIYIPDQDVSWEIEPDAFQELLHQHNRCDAKHCLPKETTPCTGWNKLGTCSV